MPVSKLKARTGIAIRATKLSAQAQPTNLQTMHERGTATSDQRRQLDLEYQDWARLQGRGPGPHTWVSGFHAARSAPTPPAGPGVAGIAP